MWKCENFFRFPNSQIFKFPNELRPVVVVDPDHYIERMHLRSLRIATTLVGVLLFVAKVAFAAVIVTGTVKDPAGAPVSGADVVIATSERATIATTQTDAQGRFQLEAPVAGRYLLLASAAGFQIPARPSPSSRRA